jgi:hypothetical protein
VGPLLIVLNLVFAGLVALAALRWRSARRSATSVDAEGAVAVRLRLRPDDEEQADRYVRRALGAAALVPTGPGGWGDRRGATARVSPPVLGDRSTVVEVSVGPADTVVAAMIEVLVEDGYEVSRQRGRRVRLRRGPDRAELQVDPA